MAKQKMKATRPSCSFLPQRSKSSLLVSQHGCTQTQDVNYKMLLRNHIFVSYQVVKKGPVAPNQQAKDNQLTLRTTGEPTNRIFKNSEPVNFWYYCSKDLEENLTVSRWLAVWKGLRLSLLIKLHLLNVTSIPFKSGKQDEIIESACKGCSSKLIIQVFTGCAHYILVTIEHFTS